MADVRGRLQAVLIENEIIPGSPQSRLSIDSREVKPIFLNDTDNQVLGIQINPSVIKELRALGLDGILISLYLLKHRDSYCSIKLIQRHLNIPMTTVYRNISKLLELGQVESQFSFEDPGKAYYKIAYQGEELMFDFYDLIHLPSHTSQPFVQQITTVCSSCGYSNDTHGDFCGNCGRKL